MPDDAELLRRFAEDADEAAFAHFVARHAGLVIGSAARRVQGDGHRAREIAQQVFLGAARHAARLAQHRCVTGWLFTATRNAALNLMREEQRRARWERAAAEGAARISEPAAPDDATWQEVRQHLEAAMDELGDRDREAVLWRYFDNLPLGEIGRRLGAGENAARMRVQRALEKLHGALVRRGVTSTVAALGTALPTRASVAVPAEVAGSLAHGACVGAALPAAGVGWAWGGFMSAWKTAGSVAGVVAVLGGLGWLTMQWREVDAARRELSRERIRAEAARTTAGTEAARVAAAESKVAAARPALPAASRPTGTAATAAAPATDAATTEAWDAEREGHALMERHPGLKEAVHARSDAMMRFRFAATLERLGATPAQIEAFVRLMREGSVIGAPFGPKRAHYSFHAGEGLTGDEKTARMREILGGRLMPHLDEVFRRADGRSRVYDLASSLALSAAPLTAVQAQQMETLLFEARGPQAGIAWASVLERAGSFLAPVQLAELERIRLADTERRNRAARSPGAPDTAKEVRP